MIVMTWKLPVRFNYLKFITLFGIILFSFFSLLFIVPRIYLSFSRVTIIDIGDIHDAPVLPIPEFDQFQQRSLSVTPLYGKYSVGYAEEYLESGESIRHPVGYFDVSFCNDYECRNELLTLFPPLYSADRIVKGEEFLNIEGTLLDEKKRVTFNPAGPGIIPDIIVSRWKKISVVDEAADRCRIVSKLLNPLFQSGDATITYDGRKVHQQFQSSFPWFMGREPMTTNTYATCIYDTTARRIEKFVVSRLSVGPE